ncbi:MAG: SDR family NAD(P)-dependent oxidoreductase, partial [Phenylobacterium sp.]|nr:SDR family NAD(P)-dependent oxidoreductase [Phenylobacterium sp.]
MGDRLKGKTAIIVGAGQTPGETIGNGRAMSILFAREGAQVLCVDRVAERAEETAAMIVAEGGQATAFTANVTKADDVAAMIEAGKERLGRIDILVNNVGIGGGDGPAHRVEEAAFDRILSVNLKGMWLTIKAAIPTMREQGGGAIVNISSLAGIAGGNQVAYEVSKAAVNRLTTSVAQSNAAKGVRCNAIMPGLMDTPLAVAGIAQASGQEQEAVRAARNARVPLGGKMGNA